MSRRKKFTRRAALSTIGLAVGAGIAEQQRGAEAAQPRTGVRDPFAAIPVTGQAGPGLDAFDSAMRTIIDRHGLAGAALAIAKEGRLVFAKGYGWANIAEAETMQPDTLFGLASLSKPFTAVAALK